MRVDAGRYTDFKGSIQSKTSDEIARFIRDLRGAGGSDTQVGLFDSGVQGQVNELFSLVTDEALKMELQKQLLILGHPDEAGFSDTVVSFKYEGADSAKMDSICTYGVRNSPGGGIHC